MDTAPTVWPKMTSSDFREIVKSEPLRELNEILQQHRFELRLCGETAVDLALGVTPSRDEIIYATNATPNELEEIRQKNIKNLDLRSDSGTASHFHAHYQHSGLVTCYFKGTRRHIYSISNQGGFHTNDWAADAARREFSIMGVFIDLSGNVHDHSGGDLAERKVTFIGSDNLIDDDPLLIFRFFQYVDRFSGGVSHDVNFVEMIKDYIQSMLDGQIREDPPIRWKMWREIEKVVKGGKATDVMRTMLNECKMCRWLCLPPDADRLIDRFECVRKRAADLKFQHPERKHGHLIDLVGITMITSLCTTKEELTFFCDQMHVEKHDSDLGEFILDRRRLFEGRINAAVAASLNYWRRLLAMEYRPDRVVVMSVYRYNIIVKILQLAITVAAPDRVIADLLSSPHPAVFPVDGGELLKANVSGRRVERVKLYLYDLWVMSDFLLTKDELLLRIRDAPQ